VLHFFELKALGQEGPVVWVKIVRGYNIVNRIELVDMNFALH
jgi:hypothetical protein